MNFIKTEETVIFKSDKDQTVVLNTWNETEEDIMGCRIQMANKILVDGSLSVSLEEKDPHSVWSLKLKKGDEITAVAGKENAISYEVVVK